MGLHAPLGGLPAACALLLLSAGRLWLRPRPKPTPAAPVNPFQMSPEERARLDQLTREDHADMMKQLGITQLRPGPNGRAAAGEPNAANYDPAKAEPLSGLAGRPDAEGRPQGHDRRAVVAGAAPGDRRGLRARGLRPRAARRADASRGRSPRPWRRRWAASRSWPGAWSGTSTTPPIPRSRWTSRWRSSSR